jgi:RNA polymerase sigma-70 factor (ECF subfamily)
MTDVSHLLVAWGEGDKSALERLMPLVYKELRDLARRQMRRERSDHSFQATELVNEAYLRLVKQRAAHWQHRAQFFSVAASIMRRILVDHARRYRYQKRGGGAVRMSLDDVALTSPTPAEQLLALDDALDALAACDGRKSQVVELRYFSGLSVEEIAGFLSVSPVTVKRDWAIAKTWLYRHMSHAHKEVDRLTTEPNRLHGGPSVHGR